jgi:hypothetical protein
VTHLVPAIHRPPLDLFGAWAQRVSEAWLRSLFERRARNSMAVLRQLGGGELGQGNMATHLDARLLDVGRRLRVGHWRRGRLRLGDRVDSDPAPLDRSGERAVQDVVDVSKHDLAARPIYHHKRESIEAHLTIVFAALAVSRFIEERTGWSIRKFVRTTRRYRTVQILAGQQILTAQDPLPADLREALATIP